MNRIVVGISSFLLSTTIVSAQRVFNPQNARDGETVEYCHQYTRLNELQQKNKLLGYGIAGVLLIGLIFSIASLFYGI